MDSVILSPKYQIVIPKKVRDSMKLTAGQKIQIIQYGNRLKLITERKISEMCRFSKRMNTNFELEEDKY